MWRTDGPTDLPTYRPTDTARCRVAGPRLKTSFSLNNRYKGIETCKSYTYSNTQYTTNIENVKAIITTNFKSIQGYLNFLLGNQIHSLPTRRRPTVTMKGWYFAMIEAPVLHLFLSSHKHRIELVPRQPLPPPDVLQLSATVSFSVVVCVKAGKQIGVFRYPALRIIVSYFFNRVHATLHPALSVRPLVCLLIHHTFTFFINFISLSHFRSLKSTLSHPKSF